MSASDSASAEKAAARATLLTRLAVRGSVFTAVGHVTGESVRFASNLVLTRLLFPEAFGLMAIATAVLQGARMFSDVGIRGSIVQHERGEEPLFYNPAWTVQTLRGLAICAALCVLAGPLAALYGKPEAAALIRIVAFAAAIDGLTSTAGFSLVRRVRPGRQIALDLGSRLFGIAATIVLAWIWRSVWALAFGAVATAAAQVVLSFRILPGYRNRFAYDRSAAQAIASFGRWVMVSSLLTFLLNQGDRLILGKLMTSAQLGVYAIANFMAFAIPEGAARISVNVLWPLYARIRALEIQQQRREIARYRSAVLAVALPGLWVLAIFGGDIVSLLYDNRYTEAGWMMRLLAIAMIPVLVSYTAERVLVAHGDSFSHTLLQLGQAIGLYGGIWMGYVLSDVPARGVIVGVMFGRLAGYLPLAWLTSRKNAWLPRVDAVVFGASALVLWLGFAWRGWP